MVSTKPSLDYYEILGLPRDASQSDIGAAFRARILAIRDQPGAGDESRRINLAYRALNDPERRRDYDEALTRPREALATPEPEAAAPPPPPPPSPPPPPPPPPLLDEPFAYEEEGEDQPERSGTRRAKLVSSAIAMLLLLLAGAWAGGLLSGGDPQVASRTGEQKGAADSGEAGVAPAAERGGNVLADALAALTGREEATPPAEPLEPGIDIASADLPPASVPGETIAAEDGTGSAVDAGEAPPAPSSETDQPLAEPEPEPAAPSAEEPSPPPAQPDPTPPAPTPPPPPVDQSAGPRLLRGGLNDSDNRGGRFQGTVGVRITVGTNGRPQGCRVVRSSGNRGLDGTTCYLLEQRLVFSPARNRDGAPIQSSVESNYVWGTRRRR